MTVTTARLQHPFKADLLRCVCSQYSDVNDDGAGQKSPYSTLGALSRLSRGSRGGRNVSFARRSNRGVSQRRFQGKETKGKEKPEDYMSKAKQLWTYVGKVRPLIKTPICSRCLAVLGTAAHLNAARTD